MKKNCRPTDLTGEVERQFFVVTTSQSPDSPETLATGMK